jgi:hypothetical protein
MPKKREEAQQAVQAAPQPMKVDFDAWWAMNEKKIPGHHRKEIIVADFKARGLSMRETMQAYNDALKLYGVKLK